MRITFDKKIIDVDRVYNVNDHLILYDMKELVDNRVSVFGLFSTNKPDIETIYDTLAEYGSVDIRHVYEEWDDCNIIIFDGLYEYYSVIGVPIYKQFWELNGEKIKNFPEEFNDYFRCCINKL